MLQLSNILFKISGFDYWSVCERFVIKVCLLPLGIECHHAYHTMIITEEVNIVSLNIMNGLEADTISVGIRRRNITRI